MYCISFFILIATISFFTIMQGKALFATFAKFETNIYSFVSYPQNLYLGSLLLYSNDKGRLVIRWLSSKLKLFSDSNFKMCHDLYHFAHIPYSIAS